MDLLSDEQIHATLKQAYDPGRVTSLYRKATYAFGEPWDDQAMLSYKDGSIVECPDIDVKYVAIGQSRRIQNTAFISLSSAMYSQPSPEFEGLDRHTAEIRKQFILARGDGAINSEWSDEDVMAYLDGDGLGFGGVQVMLRTNPATGNQMVAVEHVPAFYVIYDRHARGFGSARMVAFVKYIAPDEFEARWGAKKRKEYEAPLRAHRLDNATEALMCCRVIEYYDLGLWGQKPTRAVIAKDLDGEVLEKTPNTFECLPFAHYTFWTPSGKVNPIGRIDMQMGTHEALNEVERAIRNATKRQGMTLVDTNVADEGDVQAYIDGEAKFVRWDSASHQGPPPVQAVQGADVSATTLNWLNILERQYTTDSGQTDLDRGVQLADKRTLGEAQLLQQSSEGQGSWSMLQATKYHRRKYEIVSKLAAKFDTDPVDIDVFGVPFTVNDPADPNTSAGVWFKRPSRVTVSEDALRFQDIRAKRSLRLQELKSFVELAGPAANLQYIAEEAAKACDLDEKEALQPLPPPMPPGADPSAPGLPPGVMPPNVGPGGPAPAGLPIRQAA